MNSKLLAVMGGLAAWLVAVIVCWRVNDHRLTTVLMPLWRPVASLAGQGPNIGTLDSPVYEATPVHAMMGLAGIGLSALVYILLLYGLLMWQRSGRRAETAEM
jgi:hypothetical protein